MKKRRGLALLLAIMMVMLAACGGTGNTSITRNAAESTPPSGETTGNGGGAKGQVGEQTRKEPVTITFWNYGNTITDTEFNKLIVEPTKAKYPHITLERIKTEADTTPEDLLSMGQVPDIIYTSSGPSYYRFLDIGIIQDLDELIAKHNVDTTRIKPAILESIRGFTQEGKLIAIPLSFNLLITYYNKEIFDKFNIPYPSDEPQTWEQWLELGRKLTIQDNGVQYVGVDLGGPGNIVRSLDIGNVDSATGKSTLASEEWNGIYELLKKQYEIPGFIGSNNEIGYDRVTFMQDRRLAIRPAFLANMVGPLEELKAEGIDLDWDIAPAPHFGDNKVGGSIHSVILSNQSKHLDDAFLVIANILSDETQRLVARNGRVPSIVNPELEKEFGADVSVLQGKKIENVFKLEAKPNNPPHPLDNQLGEVLSQAAEEIALNGKDVNSALRGAEEESNRIIEAWEKTRP
ncbi:ABC transporter substrate-binding protein [Paenibacillus sp. PAMC21692]|uniref:ABC transporter substrate-binding protein n=1 Tax=Paenibacillus sp. PAMC21692 TaxID=2762320 RepID=UPI00164CE0D2|nr:extracellular solute-binding protein [Paenibacillus sp. PAMC21692]QNK56320.1 extracellular solute-binding protein [Paenibacillus sp. PAMC21692]